MWPQLLAAAAIAAAAASSAWWLTADHYQGVIAKAKLEQQKAVDEANDRADKAALEWQDWASKQAPKIVYRNRKATVIFQAEPAWSAASVPESVRRLLLDPTGGPDTAASGVAGAVPAPGPAPDADERAAGAELPGDAGFIRRLFRSSTATGQGAQRPGK